jgi:ubiquinone/menaquinone biosynthesis C-methylase UbiE
MPQDTWSAFNERDAATQEQLAAVLEARGADPQQQALRRAFLADVDFPTSARVLDVGCGTGVLTRVLGQWPGVGTVVGVDPASALLETARHLAADLPNVAFAEADGRALPFEDATFDVVTFDSELSHLPGPERALAEAARVLRPQGWLAVFDGDYATTTVALGDDDPLQVCADALTATGVHDRYVVRRLPALVRGCGLQCLRFRSYGYLDSAGDYLLSIVERGADRLCASGRIGQEAAQALKAEARRRVEVGTFFGHIAYAALVACKPA